MRYSKYMREKAGRKPWLTYLLVLAVVLVFIWQMGGFLRGGGLWMKEQFGLYGFSLQSLLEGKWWTPLTSVFLHADSIHLALNLLALFFFGRAVEQELGWKKFLVVFWGGALAGDLAIAAAASLGIMSLAIPTIGVSAAVFGLMGGAMLAKPLELVFYPYIIPVPLVFVAAVYVTYNVAAFINVLLAGAESNVAYAAHLGGLLAGIYFSFRWIGHRRGLLALLAFFLVLAAIPFIWAVLQQLQVLNYVSAIGGIR